MKAEKAKDLLEKAVETADQTPADIWVYIEEEGREPDTSVQTDLTEWHITIGEDDQSWGGIEQLVETVIPAEGKPHARLVYRAYVMEYDAGGWDDPPEWYDKTVHEGTIWDCITELILYPQRQALQAIFESAAIPF